MKKVVVFDFDGTIADTIPEFVRIINILAEKYHFHKLNSEDVERFRSYDTLQFLKEMKISMWKVPFVMRDGLVELHKTVDNVKPVLGMKTTIKQLHKQGFRLGILTSNSQKNVEKFLKKHDMEIFDFIYAGSTIFGKDKVMRSLLKQRHLFPDDILYVGDETRDIEATRKVKIQCVVGSWGYNSRERLQKYSPDFLIDKPEELLEIVKS